MKKMISMLLALVMALSLVACGAQPTTNDNDDTASGQRTGKDQGRRRADRGSEP